MTNMLARGWSAERVHQHCQDPTWSLAATLDEGLQRGVLAHGALEHQQELAGHPAVLADVQEELLDLGDPWTTLELCSNQALVPAAQRRVLAKEVPAGEMDWGLKEVLANPALTAENQAWALEGVAQHYLPLLLLNPSLVPSVLGALLARVVTDAHTPGCYCAGAARNLRLDQLGPWATGHRDGREALAARDDLTLKMAHELATRALGERDTYVLTELAQTGRLSAAQTRTLLDSGDPRLVEVGASSTAMPLARQEGLLLELDELELPVLASLGANRGLAPHVLDAMARHKTAWLYVTTNTALPRATQEFLLEEGRGVDELARNEGVDHEVLVRIHLDERFDFDRELVDNPSLRLDGRLRASLAQEKWGRELSAHLRGRGVSLEVEVVFLPTWEGSIDELVETALTFEAKAS